MLDVVAIYVVYCSLAIYALFSLIGIQHWITSVTMLIVSGIVGLLVLVLDLCFSKKPDDDIRQTVESFKPGLIGIGIRNIDNAYSLDGGLAVLIFACCVLGFSNSVA